MQNNVCKQIHETSAYHQQIASKPNAEERSNDNINYMFNRCNGNYFASHRVNLAKDTGLYNLRSYRHSLRNPGRALRPALADAAR